MSANAPFAEVRAFTSPRSTALFGLFVGGHLIDYDEHADQDGEDIGLTLSLLEQAHRINSAVEAREALLSLRLSNLRLAAAELGDAGLDAAAQLREAGMMTGLMVTLLTKTEALRRLLISETEDEPAAAVSGDVASALAFELGREKFRTESQLRGLIDHLLEEGGQATPLAMSLAEAADLRIPEISKLRDLVGAVVNERASGAPLSRHLYDRLQKAHLATRPFKAATTSTTSGPIGVKSVVMMSNAELPAPTWRAEPDGRTLLDLARETDAALSPVEREIMDRIAEIPPAPPRPRRGAISSAPAPSPASPPKAPRRRRR